MGLAGWRCRNRYAAILQQIVDRIYSHRIKNVNLDIKSFISEKVCELADLHKWKPSDDEFSEDYNLILKKIYFFERLSTFVVVLE